MLAYFIAKDFKELFPSGNQRRTRWVNTRYQSRYLLIQLSLVVGSSLVSLVLAYTFLRFSLEQEPAFQEVNTRIYSAFFGIFVVFHLLYLLGVWALSDIFSSRTAGALFAFERYVRAKMEGKSTPSVFRLRKRDDFKELELLAKDLAQRLDKDSVRTPPT
jgi:hypothetical protein